MKYNHTIWQKIMLPLNWLLLKIAPIENKKSWHEYKKGIEKHEHKFTIPHIEKGYKFKKCEHEGCYLMDPID